MKFTHMQDFHSDLVTEVWVDGFCVDLHNDADFLKYTYSVDATFALYFKVFRVLLLGPARKDFPAEGMCLILTFRGVRTLSVTERNPDIALEEDRTLMHIIYSGLQDTVEFGLGGSIAMLVQAQELEATMGEWRS